MSDIDRDPVNRVMEVAGVELRRDPLTAEYVCGYVGFGSEPAELRTKTPVHLGFCYRPERRFGLVWDLAFGYVSGFPVKALLWFALTRSLPTESMQRRIQDWELRTGRRDGRMSEIVLGGQVTLQELRNTRERSMIDNNGDH